MSARYFPHTESDINTMLEAIGVSSFAELLAGVPQELRGATIEEPVPMPEPELLERYRELSRIGETRASFVGAGLYRHYVPEAVSALLARGEFFTAYTPYQPEASQGTLQSIFEFQTMVSELLGMDVANASMYDGASAAAEAVLMSLRLLPKRSRVLLADGLHPDTVAVIRTYLGSVGATIEVLPSVDGNVDQQALRSALEEDVASVVVQSPNCLGLIEPLRSIGDQIRDKGTKLIVSVQEPTSLGLLESPGACGADIAVGEGTGIGIGPSFGGPGVGLFASRQEGVRQMPGRLVGQALDADGRVGYVLTLATREQHIRRERATSNICTNHGLCALAFTIHMALLGKGGFRELAEQSAQRARYLAEALKERGIDRRFSGPYYNELVVELGSRVKSAIQLGLSRGVCVGFDLGRWRDAWKGGLLIAVSELHSKARIDELVDLLAEASS